MHVPSGKKVYFLSDIHLGAPDRLNSLERERRLVQFLEEIRRDAAALFIVGDLFDFWFEYRKVVPKGYVRILGKLADISDAGTPVHFFVGNHDMWMNGYFESELGIPVYHDPRMFEFDGKKFMVGHGDGLGPGDHGYKMLRRVFRNPLCRALFGILPPQLGIGMAEFSSRRSRASKGSEERFLGDDREWLVVHCKNVLEKEHVDYFVFGHRHLPIDREVGPGSRYINLGDWIRYDTYAVYDGHSMELKSAKP